MAGPTITFLTVLHGKRTHGLVALHLRKPGYQEKSLFAFAGEVKLFREWRLKQYDETLGKAIQEGSACMDPDENLKETRKLIESLRESLVRRSDVQESTLDDVERLLDLNEALDGWIKNGGFLPADWCGKQISPRST